MRYLKKAQSTQSTQDTSTKAVVQEILTSIRENGETSALEYSAKLDKYSGDVIMKKSQIEQLTKSIPQSVKDDVRFAYDRVKKFAEKQKDSIQEFDCELSDGLFAGQRLIPVDTVGCYVPGGRYAHIASAVMSITTAKVAGVRNIIACSSPKDEQGMHPVIAYTMNLCGADKILNLGGVQAIASMAFGLFDCEKANFIVGPGNRFVAEAKRTLFGEVGIDQIAGPTEILVIADSSSDPLLVAADLVGQAEHGIDSPAWLISTSEEVAQKTMELVSELIKDLPESHAAAAAKSWEEYGEVVICDTKEEAAKLSDEYAPEHLEIHTKDDDWYLENLRSYGSLFIGEETNVSFGDKCSGPNHILPTREAAKYTGGLSVHKFIKVVTWQKMSRDSVRQVAPVSARISRQEGMEAHARTSDVRLSKYFPEESFTLS